MPEKKGPNTLFLLSMSIGILFIHACAMIEQPVQPWNKILEVARISPHDAHREVESGGALLVCAYNDEATCCRMLLQGAISLKVFESRLPEFTKDQLIIFYCS